MIGFLDVSDVGIGREGINERTYTGREAMQTPSVSGEETFRDKKENKSRRNATREKVNL